jgi:L-threonylcarbamoyladenylate synthase
VTAERLAADSAQAIERAVQVLGGGGLVAIPTETVYGLAVLPQRAPLERLVAVKARSADKGIQLLVDSIDQARRIARLTPADELLAARFWPGPLTLVLVPRSDGRLPELIKSSAGTLGLRLPDHEVPRRLARRLGPIAASSANLSGSPPALDADHIAATLGDEIDLLLDDGPVRGGVSSTVVDCRDAADGPRVLREGGLSAAQIEAVLRSA